MTNVTNQPQTVMQIIQGTPAVQIAELEYVRDKYIQNYNACHREKVGELMYARNMIHFKQIVGASKQLKSCDPFSLYACFATAAVNGYSLDPNDNEVYLISRAGKACLDRQAGAYIRRLLRTGQIQFCEQAKLVYEGDVFQVHNGRVLDHVENFKSDRIVAGYVRMVIGENGADRFFIYRKSDFESWRKKSSNPRTIMKQGENGQYLSESLWDNGELNGENPEPNFLRTKIIKHAAKEKCWATGNTPVNIEVFTEVEVDTDDDGTKLETKSQTFIPQGTAANVPTQYQPPLPHQPPAPSMNGKVPQPVGDDFDEPQQQAPPPPTKKFDDDEF
ncbi:MAG: recombinase RecT [Bacteroidota bacterium]|nr:recombinase RecT [Bacteroidota bacterium]